MTGTKNTILVRKDEWERFLAKVKDLVDVHKRLLKHSKELETKCARLEQKLQDEAKRADHPVKQSVRSITRQAKFQVKERKSRTTPPGVCVNCGRDILEGHRYCDQCGHPVGH